MSERVTTTPRWHRACALALAALLGIIARSPAHAQQDSTARRDGWIVGPLVGMPGVGSDFDPSFFTLGIGVTRLVPNRLGLDLAIGTLPRAFSEGAFPLAARVGPSLALALGPDAFVIPSAGLSAVGVAGPDFAGGLVGYYWGASAVVAHGPVGLRLGVTWHQPLGEEGSVWLAEIGVMRVPLPRRRD